MTDFAAALRARQPMIGTWVVTDNPIATESIAGLGFDFICVDGQHGLYGEDGWISAITAITAGGSSGIIRVPANDPAVLGRALDSGAAGVVVPMVDSAADAARAAHACRYVPRGGRSYGPMRTALRMPPAEANDRVACLVMIETAEALADIDAICAVDGLDGVLIGPFDLTLALGGKGFGDPAVAAELEDALAAVAAAAARAGIAAGVHCPDGGTAAKRLAGGFTFAMVSCDLLLLEEAATSQLRLARSS
ncbi:HpcH/HpaI aldolase family protein [Lentzea nigeriaca]|uniref:HpcH/HpaI aldolase family protein n=1 Tax=Lentzea nigeriaca TaxID=1128665 RepID=UPI0027DBF84F|nr:aldolase/citrate lyase family protein [Lentzea nigeriaca]MBM7856384.1 4-hydroxy-2-oxoheptanedioate aldolase [Lentzea nigeriaca]